MAEVEQTGGEHFSSEGAEQRDATRQDLDRAAVELAERRKVAASVKTDDLDLAERIRALGFDGDTARVFDLLPLVHVAWADGKIQKQERVGIFEVLKLRAISPSHPGYLLIESLLEREPSPTYANESLAVLKDLLSDRDQQAATVVVMCVGVAEAAGGFLGIGKIDAAERELMERIAGTLGDRAQEAFRQRLGG